MTKTAAMSKPETLDSQAEAELAQIAELFRDMDRRLKRIRKMQAESDKLRDNTQAALERMKRW